MGDMADDFRAMDEVRKKRKASQEPDRLRFAAELLRKEGHEVVGKDPGQLIVDGYISLWAYTGWWSGKGIGSGRGIHELVKKLKESRL